MRQIQDPILCGDKVCPPQEPQDSWGEVVSFTYEGEGGGVFAVERDDRFQVAFGKVEKSITHPDIKAYKRRSEGKKPTDRLDADRKSTLNEKQKRALEGFLQEANSIALRERRKEYRRKISVWTIMSHITEAGYDVWVAGGAVRDVLRGDPPNDADLAGTAPFGSLCEILTEMGQKLRFEFWVNEDKHVLHIVDSIIRSNTILDYAPLKHSWYPEGKRFRFDHDPSRDVRWRDLTVNSLLYAPLRRGEYSVEENNLLMDPTGRGLRDISDNTGGITLHPVELPESYPPEIAASRLLRLLRFVHFKYPNKVDLSCVTKFKDKDLGKCLQAFADLDWEAKQKWMEKAFYKGHPVDAQSLEAACATVGLQNEYVRLFKPVFHHFDIIRSDEGK